MEQIVAFMLLVGCAGDGETCKEIPVPTPSYASVADCETDLPLQLRLSGTYDNKVAGACTAVPVELLEQDASIEWSLDKGGQLNVQIIEGVIETASVETFEVASR